MKHITQHVLSAALSAALLSLAFAAQASEDRPVRAKATIRGCTDSNISGMAKLVERHSADGVKEVRIKLQVQGLPDGKHAVHLHEAAVCQPCGAAGGHFDPGPNGNSSPDGNHPFHLGDLVNLEVTKGKGRLSTTSTRVTLSPGPLSLFDLDGSAFIVHVNPDTYCPDGEVAGCAGGGRAACGIVEVDSEDDPLGDWFD